MVAPGSGLLLAPAGPLGGGDVHAGTAPKRWAKAPTSLLRTALRATSDDPPDDPPCTISLVTPTVGGDAWQPPAEIPCITTLLCVVRPVRGGHTMMCVVASRGCNRWCPWKEDPTQHSDTWGACVCGGETGGGGQPRTLRLCARRQAPRGRAKGCHKHEIRRLEKGCRSADSPRGVSAGEGSRKGRKEGSKVGGRAGPLRRLAWWPCGQATQAVLPTACPTRLWGGRQAR